MTWEGAGLSVHKRRGGSKPTFRPNEGKGKRKGKKKSWHERWGEKTGKRVHQVGAHRACPSTIHKKRGGETTDDTEKIQR